MRVSLLLVPMLWFAGRAAAAEPVPATDEPASARAPDQATSVEGAPRDGDGGGELEPPASPAAAPPDDADDGAVPHAPRDEAPPMDASPRGVLDARGAAPPPRQRRAAGWDAWGELRGRGVGWSDPAVDRLGTTSGRGWWTESRLIAGADWRPSRTVYVELEVEALNGQFAGQTTDLGTRFSSDTFLVRRDSYADITRLIPRKAAVHLTAPGFGQLRFGIQTFPWGTGMLANDGRSEPLFGEGRTGNIVARAAFLTSPWRERGGDLLRGMTFFVAGDVVMRDDNASLFDGDVATAGILGMRWEHTRFVLGALGVVRGQRDRRDPLRPTEERSRVLVFPVDLYGKAQLLDPAASVGLTVEAETVWIHGNTTRPYLEETLADGARVRSFGALGRLRLDVDPARLSVIAEAGYASGDNDTRDATFRTFSMHSDHNVGLILFDQYLPLMAARSGDRAADPGLTAVAPSGLRFTVPQGAVANATYLYPAVWWRIAPPLDLRAAYVAAWSSSDVIDTYETARNGGFNTTPGGDQPGRRFLGHEVDLGLHGHIPLPAALGLRLGFEGGMLWPGSALDGVDLGAPVLLGRGRLDVVW